VVQSLHNMEEKPKEQLILSIRCESIEQKEAIIKLLEECKKVGGFPYPTNIYRSLKRYLRDLKDLVVQL